jgi:hypothetical protein
LYSNLEDTYFPRDQCSTVNTVTTLRAELPGFIYRQGQWWDFFSSPLHSDRLWVPSSLLSIGYRGLFLRL